MKFRLLMKNILKILQIKLNLKCYHGKIGLSNSEFYNTKGHFNKFTYSKNDDEQFIKPTEMDFLFWK